MVTEENLAEGRVYPPLHDIRQVSTQIAAHIVEYSYRNNMAAYYPEPENKIEFIKKHQYSTDYDSFVPITYPWPGMAN